MPPSPHEFLNCAVVVVEGQGTRVVVEGLVGDVGLGLGEVVGFHRGIINIGL